jgi:hypothetical protein
MVIIQFKKSSYKMFIAAFWWLSTLLHVYGLKWQKLQLTTMSNIEE